MTSRPGAVLLATLVVTGLLFRALGESTKSPVANIILNTAYAPFFAVRSWALEQATLRSDNVRLRQLLAEMSWKAQQGEEHAREALRLRSLWDLPLGHEPSIHIGRVIGWDRRGGHEEVIVDQGASGGIAQYAPAITEEGVAGRVRMVTSDFARVQLMIDPGCRVAVRDVRSGVLGVVRMRGEGLVMDRVAVESDVVLGDTLVTAGIGGIFPAGLLVGTVIDVKKPGASLLSDVQVLSAAHFNRLDYLFFLESQTQLPLDAPHEMEGEDNP
jgi:rod shape-determining protein MreC